VESTLGSYLCVPCSVLSLYTCRFFFNFKDRHHHFPLGHSRYVLLDPAVRGSGGGAVTPPAASETFLGQSSRYVPCFWLIFMMLRSSLNPFPVFLTFWQATLLSILSMFGVIKGVNITTHMLGISPYSFFI
jgi:hypothetical protein